VIWRTLALDVAGIEMKSPAQSPQPPSQRRVQIAGIAKPRARQLPHRQEAPGLFFLSAGESRRLHFARLRRLP